ncbi:unnamed protein product, partial [Didymodactylos carnosus]
SVGPVTPVFASQQELSALNETYKPVVLKIVKSSRIRAQSVDPQSTPSAALPTVHDTTTTNVLQSVPSIESALPPDYTVQSASTTVPTILSTPAYSGVTVEVPQVCARYRIK